MYPTSNRLFFLSEKCYNLCMFKKLQSFIRSLALPIFGSGGFSIFSSQNKVNQDFYYGIILRCVDVISSSVANADFDLLKETDGDVVERNDHPAFKLLQRPNGFFTNHDLFYLTMSHILTSGAAYWYLPRALNGDIAEIWPLPPTRVTVHRGKSNFIEGYTFTNPAGVRVPLTTDEVIPIYRPNPFDMWKGISLLHAARYEADADLSAIMWNAGFFKHGAIPSGTLEVDGFLNKESAEMIRENLKELYTGKDNAHKVMVLGKGQKYNQLSPKPKEMDFVGQRTFSRDEILAIFNVPKSVIGITDDVNRANAEVADYVFAKRNIKVWLGLIFEKLNTFYLPKFKNVDGLYFDYEDPTPEDKVQELEEHKAGVNNWLTINEVRAERGLEPIEGGDVLYMPLTLVPSLQDQNTTNPNMEEEKNYLRRLDKKGVKKNDRVYLLKKRRIISQYQKALDRKMRQNFALLVKDIRRKKIEKLYKTKGSDQILTFLKPLLDNWEGLTAKILIDFGRSVGEEAVKLNDEVYEIPKVNMESLIPMLTARSQETADSVSNSIYDRARQIIARNLEEEVLDPDKIVQDIAEAIEDETDFRSERIMRTEISYSFNKSAVEDFKASGFVEEMRWILGDEACPECKQNGDEVVEVGGVFPSGDSEPPVHPNCECDLIPVI